jgi:hypothetical protein
MLCVWHIQARFEPYVPEHRIPIVDILGMTEEMTSPGAILGDLLGQRYCRRRRRATVEHYRRHLEGEGG